MFSEGMAILLLVDNWFRSRARARCLRMPHGCGLHGGAQHGTRLPEALRRHFDGPKPVASRTLNDMYDEEVSALHNPVVHELSLAGWLVGSCLKHEDYWPTPEVRGQVLRCCAELVTRVGELADRVCDQDPEVAAEVRRLTALLEHRSEQLNSAG